MTKFKTKIMMVSGYYGDSSEGLVKVVTLLQFPFILVYFFFTGCAALLSPLFQNTCGHFGDVGVGDIIEKIIDSRYIGIFTTYR